uniref:Uncharacterized protein n=1 Tax=Vitis vinifera TaxID=29760 RepID=A5AZX4_VITVI|nr:hypothetical protein VITISV_034237 [Vitis vinifera]
MIGLSKLCIVLIVVFAVFLLVIGTQLFHVYWYRKRFRRQNSTAGHPEVSRRPFLHPLQGAPLLFLLETPVPHRTPRRSPRPSCYQARVLFTIKEEEREEMEPQATDKSLSAETKSVSLGECLRVADELPELTVAVGVDEVTPFSTPCASPPYFTPSPSPTRDVGNGTTSPENVEIGNLVLAIKGLEKECSESDVSSGSKFSFVSLEVHSD